MQTNAYVCGILKWTKKGQEGEKRRERETERDREGARYGRRVATVGVLRRVLITVDGGMGGGVGDDTLYIGPRAPSARTSPGAGPLAVAVRGDGLT